ncbi:MAG: hypothetical protein R3E12_03250 [Candidatus Eisenbacteria bacterium]|uniref:Transporter n=1 Tax=Eiseniibacteriota bacterium TaxID=2212470 RepID=A0A956M339_UNCEI|nr:hypothetical protein [Candidatus Eisenbacteria bacterium]
MPVSLPVGEQFKSYVTGALRTSYSFTFSDTDHYYIGTERDDATETNVAPATKGLEHVLGIEYDLAHGITAIAEIPFVHTEQSRELGGVAGTMEANGLGDIRLLGRYWLRDSVTGPRWYGSAGIRIPTGKSDGQFKRQNGTYVTKDLAAQEGTGNAAGIVELGGNVPLGARFGMAVSARYIFTPSATTVNNFRNELTGNGPEKNSDSDALATQLSFIMPVSMGNGPLSRVSLSAFLDWAWVPYDDLFGKTEGFRRAGPIIAVGPGVGWSPTDAFTISAGVPLTIYRDVQQNGGNVQEWTFQLGLSYDVLQGGGI